MFSNVSFTFSCLLYLAIWTCLVLTCLGYPALPLCSLLALCTLIRLPPPLGQPPPVMDIFVVFGIIYSFPLGAMVLILAFIYESYYWLIPASILLLRACCNLSINSSIIGAFTSLPAFPKQYFTTSLNRLPLFARIHPFLLYFCTSELQGGVTIREVCIGDVSCDIYTSAVTDKPQPLFFFLHGGGWKGGAKRVHAQAALLHNLAARGWVVVSSDYRKTWPHHITDAITAFEHFRTHASEYNIDLKRVVLAGASAGGHLTTLLTQYALRKNISIRRQVLIYPCVDVADECSSCAVSPLHLPCIGLRCGQSLLQWFFLMVVLRGDAALWNDANPLRFVYQLTPQQAAAYPPTIIIHGNNDSIASWENSQYYLSSINAVAQNIAKRGHRSANYRACDALITIPGMRHSFEICSSSIVDTVFLGIMGWLEGVRTGEDELDNSVGSSDSLLSSEVTISVDQ